MGLFRRRRPGSLPAGTAPVVAVSAAQTMTVSGGLRDGTAAGWRGLGVPHASDQIGAYAGGQLTMVGGFVEEVQKAQGVEGVSSSWYVPAQLTSSTGYQITMRAGNAAEVQRIIGGNNGGIGPITARQMKAAVTAAQIRQSGLAAVQWAQSLSPNA